MSSPVNRNESPSLDEHAKRKRDELEAIERQTGTALPEEVHSKSDTDAEEVPPKKIKPEVDSGAPVTKAEVKQIQRNLKTMPLEDKRASEDSHGKDMDDVESDHGSNGDQSQDRVMEESSQRLHTAADTPLDTTSTPSSDIGDHDVESANTPVQSARAPDGKNGSGVKTSTEPSSTSSAKLGSGFSNASAASPFASVKPTESIFGSSSSTMKGFGAASTASPFAAVASTNVFGSKSSVSGGFGNTSSSSSFGSTASPFASTASPFASATSSASPFASAASSASPFASTASGSVFGGESSKSVFGEKSSLSAETAGSSTASPAASAASAESASGSVFGAKSIIGSVSGASPSLQKTSTLTSSQQPSSSGAFGTFGSKNSFGKEPSFNSGSFIDQESSRNDADFGSLLSQDQEDEGDLQEGDDNFGTGIFTNADQIDVQTGEEDEISIYQTKGKLYADKDKTHSWKERGKGTFKVNVDQHDTKLARLVMRADGVLRLILNVSIFSEMNVAVTGDKYVRFIGIEENKPISFLLKVKDVTVANEVVRAVKHAIERQSRKSVAVTLRD